MSYRFSILLVFCFLSIGSYSQVLDSLFQSGESSQDKIHYFINDDAGDLYCIGIGSGSNYDFFDTTIQIPGGSGLFLAKLNNEMQVQWTFYIDSWIYQTSTYTPLAFDDEGSVYYSDVMAHTTYKLSSEGELLWTAPYGGKVIDISEAGIVSIIGVQTASDSLGVEIITNEEGGVAKLNPDGSFLDGFVLDNPDWGWEELSGKSDAGYYGHRKVFDNSNWITRVELIICDENGNVVDSTLINQNRSSFDVFVTHEKESSTFYVHGTMLERSPINSEDDSYVPYEQVYVLQFNEDLDLTGQLKLTNGYDNTAYHNLLSMRILPREDALYLAYSLNSSEVPLTLGMLSPVNAEEDNLVLAKMDELMNLQWHMVIPSDYYANSIGGMAVSDSAVYYATNLGEFEMLGLQFDPSGGNDIGIFKFDNTSDNSFIGLGRVFIDSNQNGINDDTFGSSFQAISRNDLANIYYSDQDGDYAVPLALGMNTVRNVNLPQYWTRSTPDSIVVEVLENDQEITGLDFGVHPIPDIIDLRAEVTALSPLRIDEPALYRIDIWNNGTDTLDGDIILIQSADLQWESGSEMPQIIGEDSLVWNYTDLIPGEHRSIDLVEMNDLDLTSIGDYEYTILQATPVDGDTVPSNNFDLLTQLVIAAYDPNDIIVNPVCVTPEQSSQGTWLDYRVRFQNTGNAPANDVAVIDTLPEDLDLSTLELLNASHSVDIELIDRTLIASFHDIMLPDSASDPVGSNGFFRFRIKSVPGLMTGDVITNHVDIYFDQNPPIRTNTAFSYFASEPETISVSACHSYLSSNGEQTWTESGLYPDSVFFPNGCALVDYIDLTIEEVDTDLTSDQGVLSANLVGAGYQWLDCSDMSEIEGQTGQDLVIPYEGSFAVIIDNGSCIDTSSCVLASPVGLGEFSTGPDVSIVPNPMSTHTSIDLHGTYRSVRLRLYDVTGRIVRNEELTLESNIFSLRRDGLEPGHYQLVLELDDEVVQQALVIE